MAESEKKETEAKKTIEQIGKQLEASKTCPNKGTLVKLLKQASNAFPELKQSDALKFSVKPLRDSLVRHGLLDHKDKDIRLLVGICLCEVIRVLAPNPDFSHSVSRDIFRFLLSVFAELNDTASPYFSRKAKLLETVAKLRFCLVMLDIGCEDLVLKMFKGFFNVVREDHPQFLTNSMASIISSILEERVDTDPDPCERKTFQLLLDVILQNIIQERKGVASASFQLAVSVVKTCGEKLEHYISQFLTSCILSRNAVGSVIKESYHDIILEIFQIAPQMLLSVIPNLTHELLTDQVDVRIKALNLIRKLLALHGQNVARDYPHIFDELLNRFSDKSAEVRLTALSCAKALFMTSPAGRESVETLSAIQGRLLDHDDKVRMEAVNVVCDLAKITLNLTSSDLVTQAAERLRDKKVLVRSKALKKLVELYHEYCTRCAADITLINDVIEEIPGKVLMLCYEKDCPEFRPQCMELVLADLFPASLSLEERMKHWIFMFSLFKPPHVKALKTILSQKRRLQDGLKDYLHLCIIAQDNGSREAEREMEALIGKMSSCFPDPAKAKDCFQNLKELKDNGIVNLLQQCLSKGITLDFETMKDVCLREHGDWRALSEFFRLLSTKCSFNIFGSEHVHYIFDCLSSDEASKKRFKNYQLQLLWTIISAFPSLLRGLEKKFQLLLHEREILFNEQLIEMLAREGRNMSIKLSDIYSFLEEVCLEGTRVQSKLAVSAIASLADTSEQFLIVQLCKVLVDALYNRRNSPTVLQSLGCMAQHFVSTFEAHEKVVVDYIVDEIFRPNDVLALKDLDLSDDTANCCSSCKLKIFGLKTLVRSFLPHKHVSLSRPISFLLDIVQQMLQISGHFAGSITCEDDGFIRLAAAKSVLRLSRKWDLHISPQIFRLTVLTAKDHSPGVHESFARKVHKLLKNHTLPCRYACAFSYVALDSLKDLRTDGVKYLEEFIREYGKGNQVHQTMMLQEPTNQPIYVVVFLIHVLAHDSNFPTPDCRAEKTYAQFLSPLFVAVQALVNKSLFDGDLILISSASLYLRSIFNAIKKAEDAVDTQMTPRLHLLAEVGISILDSLNTSDTSVSLSPGLILLPSSLYGSVSSEMREAHAYPSIGCKADAIFFKNLVSWLKAEVSTIGGVRTECSKQSCENSLRTSGTRQSRSNPKSGCTDNLLTNKTKEQTDKLHTGEKEQRDGSVVHEKFSAENGHKNDAHRNLENKHLSSCDSVKTTPSLSQKEITASSSREEDAVTTCGSTEQPELSGTSNDVNYTSKLDRALMLQDSDNLQAQHCSDSSPDDQAKILEAYKYNFKQEKVLRNGSICTRKVSQAVKRTKRHEDAIDISTSEVINFSDNNIARRTRRRKV